MIGGKTKSIQLSQNLGLTTSIRWASLLIEESGETPLGHNSCIQLSQGPCSSISWIGKLSLSFLLPL